MAFNNEEILTLAKAGFTAQQIAALNMVGSAAPSVDTTVPTAPTESQAPTVTAPQIQQPTTPAPVAAPTPAPTPAPQGATAADILKAISVLSAQVTT